MTMPRVHTLNMNNRINFVNEIKPKIVSICTHILLAQNSKVDYSKTKHSQSIYDIVPCIYLSHIAGRQNSSEIQNVDKPSCFRDCFERHVIVNAIAK